MAIRCRYGHDYDPVNIRPRRRNDAGGQTNRAQMEAFEVRGAQTGDPRGRRAEAARAERRSTGPRSAPAVVAAHPCEGEGVGEAGSSGPRGVGHAQRAARPLIYPYTGFFIVDGQAVEPSATPAWP